MFNSLKNHQEKITQNRPLLLNANDRYRREVVQVHNPLQEPTTEERTTKNPQRDERSGCPLPGARNKVLFDSNDNLSDAYYGFVPYSVRTEPNSVEAPMSAIISSSQFLPASEDSITEEPNFDLWRTFGRSPIFPKTTVKPKIVTTKLSTTTVATTIEPNCTSAL